MSNVRKKFEIMKGCIDSILLPIAETLLVNIKQGKPEDAQKALAWIDLNNCLDELGVRLCDLEVRLEEALKAMPQDIDVELINSKSN